MIGFDQRDMVLMGWTAEPPGRAAARKDHCPPGGMGYAQSMPIFKHGKHGPGEMNNPYNHNHPAVANSANGGGVRPCAETSAQNGEESLRTAFNLLEQGFCTIRMIFDEAGQPVDYVFLEVNQSFERNTGLVGAIGQRMRQLRPEHEKHWYDIYGRIALTGMPERFENYAAALNRWYDVHAFRVGVPEQRRVAILFEDITARKNTEQALRQSETRFRTLFESISEGFVIGALIRDAAGHVRDFRYIEVAPSFYALTGLAPEAVVGRTMIEVFHHIDDIWMEAYHKAGRGVCSRVEGYFDSLGRWFQASFTPLGNDQVAIFFSDVSELYRREREQTEARTKADAANIAKSKFLAAASHDLRQPVQSLLLFSQVLATKLAGHPAQGVAVKMSTALDKFKELLDSLLDLSTLDAGLVTPEVKPHSMAALLQELADAYQPRLAAKGLRLRRHMGNEWAMVDATLLRRIISNLLDNALKYTPKGGVLLACRRAGEKVRIDVIDTGVGIPVHHFDEIFDEFVQVGEIGREQNQGMGLGLATVKRLAELLGYTIVLRSKPGAGSCFTIMVPAADALAVDTEKVAAVEYDNPPCRVLVVDDDGTIVEGMKALLETAGYEVVTATRADDAFAVMYGDRPPDAVVADYRLGGAVTGIGLIEEARRRTGRSLPGIVMTGDTGIRSRPELAVLHKPVAPNLLKKTLAKLCR